MSLESILQLPSCVSETQKETVRNGTERVSSRLATPPHLLVYTILRVIGDSNIPLSSQIANSRSPNFSQNLMKV